MGKEKRVLSKGEKNVIKIMTIVSVFALITFACLLYVNDYYRATDVAQKMMIENDANVLVTDAGGHYLLDNPDEDATKGIIFYQGAKVDEVAYAPLLVGFAERGYEVYLVKMPAKLAMFGMNAADGIIEENAHITEWTMMGHSFGGAMAASYCASHDDQIDALVLLAAYSTEDLSDKDVRVYSFYGSEDKVLNLENYEKYYSNLPDDVIEEVIDGGNHANFGYYGEQDGDGEASITREEQQDCVIDIFMNVK